MGCLKVRASCSLPYIFLVFVKGVVGGGAVKGVKARRKSGKYVIVMIVMQSTAMNGHLLCFTLLGNGNF